MGELKRAVIILDHRSMSTNQQSQSASRVLWSFSQGFHPPVIVKNIPSFA
jgi:hypothetical protein